mmetsp:Transcript_41841/g.125204  ORF Transcript_41841/g.125204 Transcript_41841/m.125204 type:complete len:274 (-) Transcript_41841:269-1090(-)
MFAGARGSTTLSLPKRPDAQYVLVGATYATQTGWSLMFSNLSSSRPSVLHTFMLPSMDPVRMVLVEVSYDMDTIAALWHLRMRWNASRGLSSLSNSYVHRQLSKPPVMSFPPSVMTMQLTTSEWQRSGPLSGGYTRLRICGASVRLLPSLRPDATDRCCWLVFRASARSARNTLMMACPPTMRKRRRSSHARLNTGPPPTAIICRLTPLSVQMPTVLSMEPLKSRCALAVKNRLVTIPLCPVCVRSSWPLRRSHTLIFLSPSADVYISFRYLL